MVRNYKRKTDSKYTLETLKKAILEVKNGELNSYQASRKYGIPRTTIVDRVKRRRGVIKDTRGRPTEIDVENERRLATGLRTLEKYGFALSAKETTTVVSKFIVSNKLKTSFKDNVPGYDWLSAFLKRNKLSLKKPQAVEMSRKAACDPFIIDEYFNTLQSCINELNLTFNPERIWNLDESSFSKDPEKTKVVGAKGFASTRTIASGGKDNVTVLFTASALGEKLPPLIIYRGKNVWDQWMSANAFEGTSYAATKNGWMESKIFEKYMLGTVLPHLSKESPCLLIYDGHSTHIQLKILEKAAEMGVTILKLPSHASHLLQPLDLAVFKSMKDKWDAKILAWQRLNVGAKLQKNQFSQILGEVWKELDPKIIRNGFKKGGVFPFNRNVIPEDKFDPESLKRFLKAKTTQRVPLLSNLCLSILNTNNSKASKITILNPSEIIIPGTGTGSSKIEILENRIIHTEKSFENLLLSTIKSSDSTIKIKKRKAAKGCEVITRENYLQKLRNEEAEKENIEKEKEMKKLKKVPKKQKPPKKEKKMSAKVKKQNKKLLYSSDESSNDMILNDDTDSEDWNTYCENILQDHKQQNCILDYESSSDQILDGSIMETHEKLDDTGGIDILDGIRHPQVDDWLVVKFATKRTVKHFVGNVISMVQDSDNIIYPKIKFLRIIKNSKVESFHYPDVEDISVLKHDADIVKFLAKPEITRRGRVIFKENLKVFNIQ